MRKGAAFLAVFLLSCCLSVAGDHDHGIGFGFTGGTLEADGLDGEVDFTGFTVFA